MAQNEKKDKEEAYPRLKEIHSIKPTLYNVLNWGAAFGHATCAMGLMLGYYSVYQGGDIFWVKYKTQRRMCLFAGIVCGITSVKIADNEWENRYKILDYADRYPFIWPLRGLHAFAVPSLLLYIEFFGGSEKAKYALPAIVGAYISAKFFGKFKTDYFSSYFLQAKQEKP